MDQLPMEIMDSVLDFLVSGRRGRHAPSLAPYSSISRKWQLAVESRTMKHIQVRSDGLERFSTIFSREHQRRRQVLHSLSYDFVYHPIASLPQEEQGNARDQMGADFEHGLRALFGILKGWQDDMLSLKLKLAMAFDVPASDFENLLHDIHPGKSLLHFQGDETLPNLNRVQELDIPFLSLGPSAFGKIARSLPGLHGFSHSKSRHGSPSLK
jgi:hypothetical protein